MDVAVNSSLGLTEGKEPKIEAAKRLLHRQSLRRIWTMMSLVSLSLGFSAFGVLIIANRQRADLNGSGESFDAAIGGVGGLVIGVCFLVAACLALNYRALETGWKPILH
jgi:hypothetical protein